MKKIIFVINSILIVLMIILFKYKVLFNIDNMISSYVYTLRNPFFTLIMKFISFLGSSKLIIPSLFITMFVDLNKSFKITINMSISTCLNKFLKVIFKRRRPLNYVIKESGYSFPSGHAMGSFSFYGYLIYNLYKSRFRYKRILIIIFSFIILLIGFSRIYLGAHYFSDIIFGYMVSLEHLIIYITFIDKKIKNA